MEKSPEKKATKVEKKVEKKPIISKKYLTPVGNKIQPIYELYYDEKSRKELVKKVGEQDIDDFIQKSSNATDMAYLIREAQRTGQYPIDENAKYGVDMTLMPTNIHELYKTTSDINKRFEGLDPKVQAAFGSAQAYKDAVLNGSAEKLIEQHFIKLAQDEAKKAIEKEKEGKE